MTDNQEPPDGYWHRRSDEELLSTAFVVENPETLDNLLLEVPAAGGSPYVEFAYDYRGTPRSEIRCAHCRYPNHLAGFVMRVDSGERFLVGKDCGGKIYGAQFEQFKKDYDGARERASNLRRMQNLKAALPSFVEWLSQFRLSRAFYIHQQTRMELREKMPRLYGALGLVIVRHGGELVIDEEVRDFAAEARDEERYEREMEEWNQGTVTERKKRRREYYAPEKPRKPITTTRPKLVGVIRTPTLFGSASSPRAVVDDIVPQFERLLSDPPRPELVRQFVWQGRNDDAGRGVRVALTDDQMHSTLRDVTRLLDQLETQIGRLKELVDFFQPHTLTAVAAWATARKDINGIYQPKLNAIELLRDGVATAVVLSPDYHVPDTAAIAEFRRRIEDRG